MKVIFVESDQLGLNRFHEQLEDSSIRFLWVFKMTQHLLDEAVCYPMLLSLPPLLLVLCMGDTHPCVRSGDMTSEGRCFREYLPAEQAGVSFGCALACL